MHRTHFGLMLVTGGEVINLSFHVKGFLILFLGDWGHAQCLLQVAAGVGRRLRGLQATAKDWPYWISSQKSCHLAQRGGIWKQWGSNQTTMKNVPAVTVLTTMLQITGALWNCFLKQNKKHNFPQKRRIEDR